MGQRATTASSIFLRSAGQVQTSSGTVSIPAEVTGAMELKRACVKLASLLSNVFGDEMKKHDKITTLLIKILVRGLGSGNGTVIEDAESGLKALVPDEVHVDIEKNAVVCSNDKFTAGFKPVFATLLNHKTLTLEILEALGRLVSIVGVRQGVGHKCIEILQYWRESAKVRRERSERFVL